MSNSTLIVTSITRGVIEVECRQDSVIYGLAVHMMELAKEAQANPLLRPVVYDLMKAAAGDEGLFQIHNGDRVLMYTGHDVNKCAFLIGLPGESIDLWSVEGIK
jgi:hypothetical protein